MHNTIVKETSTTASISSVTTIPAAIPAIATMNKSVILLVYDEEITNLR